MKSTPRSLRQKLKLTPKKYELLEKLRRDSGLDTLWNDTIPKRHNLDSYPLSFTQKRLWFLQSLNPDNPFFNSTEALKIKGNLNVTALEASLATIEKKHEILRASFSTINGQPVQTIAPLTGLKPSVVDLQGKAREIQEQAIKHLIDGHNLENFALDHGPLVRIGLLILNRDEHVLIITIHHIISDGWAFNLLLKELNQYYLEFLMDHVTENIEPNIQYSDYAEWQSQWMQGNILEEKLKYVRNLLANNSPTLELPTDGAAVDSGPRLTMRTPTASATAAAVNVVPTSNPATNTRYYSFNRLIRTCQPKCLRILATRFERHQIALESRAGFRRATAIDARCREAQL